MFLFVFAFVFISVFNVFVFVFVFHFCSAHYLYNYMVLSLEPLALSAMGKNVKPREGRQHFEEKIFPFEITSLSTCKLRAMMI